jgi:hypothetical protein
MIKSLIRTFRGPSRDPRMTYISRPLPRDLLDEEVVRALELAFAANPDPAYLAETLAPALREVTGKDYQVLDRSVRDVTGSYRKVMVMVRDGDIGLWPGWAARAYPMLAADAQGEETRAAIAAADGDAPAPSPTSPVGKPGWRPPGPRTQAATPTDASDAEEPG